MIETEHLRLREWREEDKPTFHRIANTPAMMAPFGGVTTPDRIDALVDAQIAGQAANGHCLWAVETKSDGALVGMCGVRIGGYAHTTVPRELEIGWRVAEHLWGQGTAREAAEAAIAWSWAHTVYPRIAAWLRADNDRSRGLLLRLGMTRRPELDFSHPHHPVGDPLRDMIVYTLERPA